MSVCSTVFRKEMVTLSRRRVPYVLRALILGGLLIVLGITWNHALAQANASGAVDYSVLGQRLYKIFLKIQLMAVYFLIPPVFASVVAGERERGTLQLLLLSHLQPGTILVDKVISRLLVITLLLLSCLPMFFALLSFGGVNPHEILVAYIGIFATVFYCSALSLFFSTAMHSIQAALFGTYTSLAVFLVILAWLGNYFTGNWRDLVFSFDDIIYSNGQVSGSWYFYCSFSVLCFTAAVIRCIERLSEDNALTQRYWFKRTFSWMNAFFHRINLTGIIVVHESGPLLGNPVWWRESHKRFFATNIFLIRTSYLLCAATLAFFAYAWPLEGYLASQLSCVHLLFVLTVSMVFSATAFTHEKERATFHVLMSTPLESRAIIIGKFYGVIKALLVITLVPLIMPLVADVAVVEQSYRPRALMHIGLWLVAYLPFIVVTGLYCSARCRTSLYAFLNTAWISVAWYLAPMVITFMFGRVDRGYSYEPVLNLSPIFWVKWQHPLLAALLLVAAWVIGLSALIKRFDRLVDRE